MRCLSAARSHVFSTSRRLRVAGWEKKETARSLGESLSARNTVPCLESLWQKQVKLYTLFRTARPKNHTLSSGTSLYSPNKGVPPVIIMSKSVFSLSWRKTDFGQSIRPAADQLATAFTIPNCLEYELFKVFLVQKRQQSFWKSSILSNILDLQWCLPNKWKIHSKLSAIFTCWDGKGGKLSSQASKMLYKPPGAVYTASYNEPLDQSDYRKLFVQLWNYTKTV